MKEITILSGKGGTGKTTVTAALASLAQNIVLCDNDVDAADLHLLMKPVVQKEFVFAGAWQASVNEKECIQCNICVDACRFDAIKINVNGFAEVQPFKCEGCRLCEKVCPVAAIDAERSTNNHWYISNTRYGTMVHATMGPGEENSGKLVSTLRKEARRIAVDNELEFIINDGPPGIGCSAISALTGTNLVVLVTEPSKSGLMDASRLVELTQSFEIPIVAVINKADINESMCLSMENYFVNQGIPLLAKIPFSKDVVKAMIQGETILEYKPYSELSRALIEVWDYINTQQLEKKL